MLVRLEVPSPLATGRVTFLLDRRSMERFYSYMDQSQRKTCCQGLFLSLSSAVGGHLRVKCCLSDW